MDNEINPSSPQQQGTTTTTTITSSTSPGGTTSESTTTTRTQRTNITFPGMSPGMPSPGIPHILTFGFPFSGNPDALGGLGLSGLPGLPGLAALGFGAERLAAFNPAGINGFEDMERIMAIIESGDSDHKTVHEQYLIDFPVNHYTTEEFTEQFAIQNGITSDCNVCMCSFMPDDDEGVSVMTLPCEHYFHEACATGWLRHHHSCPQCRHLLPLKPIERAQSPSLHPSPTSLVGSSIFPTEEVLSHAAVMGKLNANNDFEGQRIFKLINGNVFSSKAFSSWEVEFDTPDDPTGHIPTVSNDSKFDRTMGELDEIDGTFEQLQEEFGRISDTVKPTNDDGERDDDDDDEGEKVTFVTPLAARSHPVEQGADEVVSTRYIVNSTEDYDVVSSSKTDLTKQ
jgi:hypothetical protein